MKYDLRKNPPPLFCFGITSGNAACIMLSNLSVLGLPHAQHLFSSFELFLWPKSFFFFPLWMVRPAVRCLCKLPRCIGRDSLGKEFHKLVSLWFCSVLFGGHICSVLGLLPVSVLRDHFWWGLDGTWYWGLVWVDCVQGKRCTLCTSAPAHKLISLKGKVKCDASYCGHLSESQGSELDLWLCPFNSNLWWCLANLSELWLSVVFPEPRSLKVGRKNPRFVAGSLWTV